MVRKTVTLVFCDVEDSTPLGEQLDPEALRGVWTRYHDTARAVLERHGGTIEKFVGDAVLGVFGIPVVHEDDALRAVRAAVELRGELARLNDELEAAFGIRIGVRTGVHTGEVYAGDPAQGDPFATGDAVNVAQRLEATATAGEILVGDATIRLVRDAVTVEPVPALALKGKSEPVDAWRLLDVEPDAAGVARRMDSPLVGRAVELDALLAELERVVSDRACRIVTIVGEPGVGKSRLAAELIASGGDDVLSLEGKCLPYGSGITYWPLVEMVRRLDLAEVLAGEPDGETVHARILEAVGRAEQRSRSDELYWAVRRLFETLALQQPARARTRRHSVGGARLPRPRRISRRLEPRRPDSHLLPRAARHRRDSPGLDGHHDPARPAAARRGAAAARTSRRATRSRCGRGHRSRDGREPALPRGDDAHARRGRAAGRARRPAAGADGGRFASRARNRAGRTRGQARPARRGGVGGAPAGRRHGSGVPVGGGRRSHPARSDQRPRPPSAGARP